LAAQIDPNRKSLGRRVGLVHRVDRCANTIKWAPPLAEHSTSTWSA
jgi:hypothetical protein